MYDVVPKQYTRAHCDNTFQGLERTIEKALDSVNVEMIRKYFRKAREYHRAYRGNIEIGKENNAESFKSIQKAIIACQTTEHSYS